MNGKTVNVQYSQAVARDAPFTGDTSDDTIGDPAITSEKVCRWKRNGGNGGEGSYATGPMDCICELKPERLVLEFV